MRGRLILWQAPKISLGLHVTNFRQDPVKVARLAGIEPATLGFGGPFRDYEKWLILV